MAADGRLGVPRQDPLRVVIDYSAPKVAKEMHVGQLRTTVVGDALARTLEHLGHEVVRQNHIGDWGTPFGMLIEHLLDVGEDGPDAGLVETDPNAFYQASRARFEDEESFATRSRARVVSLQAGDPETLRLWDEPVELGADRKLLRTRSSAPLRLTALLEETRALVAPQVGIGAIKYADLSVAHDSEYVFDLARMVQLTGDTGPHLQYAAARIRSIFRNADAPPDPAAIDVGHRAERALFLLLLGFGDVVTHVGAELEPHRLRGYLFELAQAFSVFYEHCPVRRAEPGVRESRFAPCALTPDVLVQGLGLLGIEAPERM